MKVLYRKLDIDRWMSRVLCGCGAEFWHCERRPVKCPTCGKAEDINRLVEEHKNSGG